MEEKVFGAFIDNSTISY